VASQPAWWQRGAIYQIYPRSFADAGGDGVGDLAGIAAHLDHIAELGFEAIWLSPFYRSPMADYGYDVADYCDVDPIFGTLDDFDRLVEAAHACAIRVVVDWVANHSSDRHEWFVQSASSRDNPRRDWYVWRDGAPGGGPPNDWTSEFPAVGRAWSFDDATEQWYLHSFMAEQPDLNWDNPEVEAACTTRCASGWTAAWTASASTRSSGSRTTRCCARTARARRGATTRTGRRCTTACGRSGASSTSTTTA
jgi:alpha-glucosidase